MPKKGRKKLRGQPEIYDEVKGQVSLSLTKTSVQGLDEIATSMGLSRSEFVEQVGRRLIPVLTSAERTAVKGALLQAISLAQRELENINCSDSSEPKDSDGKFLSEQVEQWQRLLERLDESQES